MEIKFFCPRWGSEKLPWDAFIKKVKKSGFDGIEWAVPGEIKHRELDKVCSLAERYELLLIAQHNDTHHGHFSEHQEAYGAWLKKIFPYPWHKINSQTGKDYFSFEQNKKLIELAGPKVIHETHPGRFSFAAHITKSFIDKMPNLRLTLDASHWVNGTASYLCDQAEAMQAAISRTSHIHARVGFSAGPQVTNPELDVWQEALQAHIAWWDEIFKINPSVSVTCEFGPFPYMPYQRNNQWEINLFMRRLFRERYESPKFHQLAIHAGMGSSLR